MSHIAVGGLPLRAPRRRLLFSALSFRVAPGVMPGSRDERGGEVDAAARRADNFLNVPAQARARAADPRVAQDDPDDLPRPGGAHGRGRLDRHPRGPRRLVHGEWATRPTRKPAGPPGANRRHGPALAREGEAPARWRRAGSGSSRSGRRPRRRRPHPVRWDPNHSAGGGWRSGVLRDFVGRAVAGAARPTKPSACDGFVGRTSPEETDPTKSVAGIGARSEPGEESEPGAERPGSAPSTTPRRPWGTSAPARTPRSRAGARGRSGGRGAAG